MRIRTPLRLGVLTAAAALALLGSGSAATVNAAAVTSPGAAACLPGAVDTTASGARVRPGGTAAEPALYPKNEANAYGALKDLPTLADGSVRIDTVFHMVDKDAFTTAEKARWQKLIAAQMQVLNDSYSGATASGAADTPFRFRLVDTTWTTNPAWYAAVPGSSAERDMKKALYRGDATTLNVYGTEGGGLLGWAYFPKGYNNGRDYIDGVVMMAESMPGGTGLGYTKYTEGDTLTHESGHWLMLEHTFAHGCAANGDWVADTAPEAIPQFDCPIGADTCAAPGVDPIHNFMDYSQDSCMNMFTQGQSDRMSDAWQQFRAGGGKS